MRTCSRCNTQSPDATKICPSCGADLLTFSVTAQSLKKLQENPRVIHLRLVVADDACPACQQFAATYEKNEAPQLPVEGCSHHYGCRCFYEPMLDEIYP